MAKSGRMVKESMVDELAHQLSEQPHVFVAGVNRLKASDADGLRRRLAAARARFVVVKRRIGLRTLERLKLTGIEKLLEGSVGFVLTADDVLPIAKEIADFIASHENQLVVRGAFIDGQLLDKARVEALAKLPPKVVLLAQVVGTVEQPLADVILTIEQLIGDVVWIIEQLSTRQASSAGASQQDSAASPPQASQGS